MAGPPNWDVFAVGSYARLTYRSDGREICRGDRRRSLRGEEVNWNALQLVHFFFFFCPDGESELALLFSPRRPRPVKQLPLPHTLHRCVRRCKKVGDRKHAVSFPTILCIPKPSLFLFYLSIYLRIVGSNCPPEFTKEVRRNRPLGRTRSDSSIDRIFLYISEADIACAPHSKSLAMLLKWPYVSSVPMKNPIFSVQSSTTRLEREIYAYRHLSMGGGGETSKSLPASLPSTKEPHTPTHAPSSLLPNCRRG